MLRLYADEHFPRIVSELLRRMGHDVLTVQEAGNANLGFITSQYCRREYDLPLRRYSSDNFPPSHKPHSLTP